jgi:hypothetical protein
VTIEENSAFFGRDKADDHVKGSSLAGAVRAQQADHLAALYFDRERLDDLAELVTLRDILNAEDTHGPPSSDSGSG